MSGSGVKRKVSLGGSGSSKKKKQAEDSGSPTRGGRAFQRAALTLGTSVKEPFCIVEADGTVEDSKVWGPTYPLDMRRWLPEKMVMLIQASMTLEEWRGKAKWMVAYVFVRVRNFSTAFVKDLLQCCMPLRDNIVDSRTETRSITEYMYELQTSICGELERISNRWIRGQQGKIYIEHIKEARRKGERRRRLSVKEIEDYFDFSVEDYAAIWAPISFVLDPGFWNPNGISRLDYDQLRLATLAMICRIVVVLLTGKVQNRVLSNNIRIRILDSTCSDSEIRPWPSMVSSGGRPDDTSAWEEECPKYPEYKDSPMYQHLWQRIDPPISAPEYREGNQGNGVEVGVTTEKNGESEHITQAGNLARVIENVGELDSGRDNAVTGGDNEVGFVSLERAGAEDSTLSGSAVQGLIDDVEAQLMNQQKNEIQRNEVQNIIQKDAIEGLEGNAVEQREAVYMTDEEVSAESEDESFNIPMSIGSEFSMPGYEGLLSLEVLGELDSYRRDDSELDGRILELLRPTQDEQDLRSYILNQAVKLTFLGPLGMARWNIEACLEIVRRCEELYLLIDKKIERTVQVIEKLEKASLAAVESVERLDYLRGMLGESVDKMGKSKSHLKRVEAQSREQREQRIMRSVDMRSLDTGRRGVFETPKKQPRVTGRFQTSVTSVRYSEEEGGGSLVNNKVQLQGWATGRPQRGFVRTNSGVSADGSLGEDVSPSQTLPASPVEGIMLESGGGICRNDTPRILARAAKGGTSGDWNDQTVDDEELRLGG